MIFYFSGTGNSQLVARQIAETSGDEIISINHILRENQKEMFQSERPLIFVTPTYAWRMPKVVEQWIREARFEGSHDAYFILTCAGGCGNAQAYAKALCAEKGLRFCGLASVTMPENYLAMFETPDESECRKIIKNAKPEIAKLAALVQKGHPLPEMPVSVGSKLLSGPIHGMYYPLFVRDKGFRVSDACVSCGKCALRCPLDNLDMVKGKPVWKGNCTHCMACISGCPAEAIEYGSKSKGQHRHYIMEN